MMDQEYHRVLNNPDNFILSQDLKESLEMDVVHDDFEDIDKKSVEAYLSISDEKYLCIPLCITRVSSEKFIFKVSVPVMPTKHIIEGRKFNFLFHGSLFDLEEGEDVIIEEGVFLTFTARRIIKNEEVSI